MKEQIFVGEKVRKIKGYKFEGIVVAIFPTLTKKHRCVVEVEEKQPYGWCGGCGVKKSLPIDRQCADCGELLEVVQFENNCAGMLHIYSMDDIELIK